jgi:rod shape-determining protein MreC
MQNEKRAKYTNILFVILITISLIFLFARATPYIRFIKTLAYYIAYPAIDASHKVVSSANIYSENIKSLINAHQENLQYKKINRELSDKLRSYNRMRRQYENLVDLLKMPKIENSRSVFARVSLREPSEWYQWIIIDKGSEDGLYNELPVEALGKDGQICALGRIVETYSHSAKVALVTNLLSVVPVQIKDKNINCLAEGLNSSTMKITYIPFDADIVAGDEIIVSDLSSVFIPATSLAVIKKISNEPSVDFKTAEAKIIFDINDINVVAVFVPIKEASD